MLKNLKETIDFLKSRIHDQPELGIILVPVWEG